MRVLRTAALLTLFVLALAGCASGPPLYSVSPEGQAKATQLTSTDPLVQRQRWGDMAEMADQYWIGYLEDRPASVKLVWVIPGVVLDHVMFISPHEWLFRLQYNAETGKVDAYNVKADNRYFGEVQVESDGAVQYPSFLVFEGHRFSRAGDGRMIFNRDKLFRPVSEQEHAEQRKEALQAHRDGEKRKERESAEFWSSVAKGLQGTANGMTQAQQQKRQQELDLHYRTQNQLAQQRASNAPVQTSSSLVPASSSGSKTASSVGTSPRPTTTARSTSGAAEYGPGIVLSFDDDKKPPPKAQAVPAAKKAEPVAPVYKAPPKPQCKLVTKSGTMGSGALKTSREEAVRSLRTLDCSGAKGGSAYSTSKVQCQSKDYSLTAALGYGPKVESKILWSCTASYTCLSPHEVCPSTSGPKRGSAQ